jgi:hypothetical protein
LQVVGLHRQGVVIVIGVHGMVGFASDLGIHVMLTPLPPRFPASGSPLRAGPGGR